MDLSNLGRVLHFDLTVPNAEEISKFYSEVVGWGIQPLSMGSYDDYMMTEPQNNEPVAGICHSRGGNAYLPPQWLLYLPVADLNLSLEKCEKMGGKIIGEKKKMGEAFYCLIQDPAGAYIMICGK